jgi:hypothetical protein
MDGTDIDYTNKVVVVHQEPKKDNEEDTYTQYSLFTGEKLMTYTYSPFIALIPNTSHKRFIGYLSKQSSAEEKPKNLATVSYAGSNEILDKINIFVKGTTAVPEYTPELKLLTAKESPNSIANEGKTVIMAQADKHFQAKDIGGFGFSISYAIPEAKEPVVIFIPVRDDHLDLTNAMYDKGIFELTKAE